MAGSSATAPWSAGFCKEMQGRLNSVFQTNNPEFKMDHIGLLEAVQSTSASITGLPQSGKRNESTARGGSWEATWTQRYFAPNHIRTTAPNCSPENERVLCTTDYTVDNYYRSTQEALDEWEVRRICDGETEFMDRAILSMMNAMVEEQNQALHADVVANIGNFKGGAALNTYTILNNDSSNRPAGVSVMRRDLLDALTRGQIHLVGHGNWFIYEENRRQGGLAQTGQLTNEFGGYTFHFDPFVSDATSLNGANEAFVIGDGSVILSEWAANVGHFDRSNDIFTHTTLRHPQTGLLFDFVMVYDHCGNDNNIGTTGVQGRNWVWYLERTWGTAYLPDLIWQNNDPMFGINYVFNVQGDQAP